MTFIYPFVFLGFSIGYWCHFHQLNVTCIYRLLCFSNVSWCHFHQFYVTCVYRFSVFSNFIDTTFISYMWPVFIDFGVSLLFLDATFISFMWPLFISFRFSLTLVISLLTVMHFICIMTISFSKGGNCRIQTKPSTYRISISCFGYIGGM